MAASQPFFNFVLFFMDAPPTPPAHPVPEKCNKTSLDAKTLLFHWFYKHMRSSSSISFLVSCCVIGSANAVYWWQLMFAMLVLYQISSFLD